MTKTPAQLVALESWRESIASDIVYKVNNNNRRQFISKRPESRRNHKNHISVTFHDHKHTAHVIGRVASSSHEYVEFGESNAIGSTVWIAGDGLFAFDQLLLLNIKQVNKL